MTQPNPLDIILQDIHRGLGAGLFYLSLSLSLSVPDICSSLEVKLDPDKKWPSVESRYKAWCQTYLQPQFNVFTAEDCWALRGSVVHNGRLHGHPKARYTRVVFGLPNGQTVDEFIYEKTVGNVESLITLDLALFCKRITVAANTWYEAKHNDPIVAKNLPNLVRLRLNGLPPIFVNLPVIA